MVSGSRSTIKITLPAARESYGPVRITGFRAQISPTPICRQGAFDKSANFAIKFHLGKNHSQLITYGIGLLVGAALLLYCPYCVKQDPISQSHEAFSPAGQMVVDTLNKATVELMVHSHGCGKLFLTVFGAASRDAMGCFPLPDDWDHKPRNPPKTSSEEKQAP